MTTSPLPIWASDILASAPHRGGGLNVWLLRAAIALRRCGRDERDIVLALSVATAGEATRADEIERAAKRSAEFLTADGKATAIPTAKWPAVDADARRQFIALRSIVAADLWDLSPYRLLDDGPDTETLVDLLFPGNPLLCVACTLADARTMPRESWRGSLASRQFIVPSPMSATTGRTKDDRLASRCLGNTGRRRYLVVEQDQSTADEQAAILYHLAKDAPLACVVSSGGKSLHGWFVCAGVTDERHRRFFANAVRLGADPATWSRCQLVRLPEGRRDNGNRQSLLYLNPSALPTKSN